MATTSLGAPYPVLADAPNVPEHIKQLADWADDKSVVRFANTAARDQAIQSPVVGQMCYITEGNRVQVYEPGGWADIRTPLDAGQFRVYQPFITITTPDTWFRLKVPELEVDVKVPFSGALEIVTYAAVTPQGGNPPRNIFISYYITDVGTGADIVAPAVYRGAQQQNLGPAYGPRSIQRTYIQPGLVPDNLVRVSLVGRMSNTDSTDDDAGFLDASLLVRPFVGDVSVVEY